MDELPGLIKFVAGEWTGTEKLTTPGISLFVTGNAALLPTTGRDKGPNKGSNKGLNKGPDKGPVKDDLVLFLIEVFVSDKGLLTLNLLRCV